MGMMNPTPPRTLPELIAQAIAFERDAASRFHEYAAYMADVGQDGIADIFRRLEIVERAHMEALQACVDGGKLSGLHATRVALDLAFPRAPRNVREALVMALAAERRAEIYYRYAAANSPNPFVRGFAADMAAGEHRHVRLMERLLARAAVGGAPQAERAAA